MIVHRWKTVKRRSYDPGWRHTDPDYYFWEAAYLPRTRKNRDALIRETQAWKERCDCRRVDRRA